MSLPLTLTAKKPISKTFIRTSNGRRENGENESTSKKVEVVVTSNRVESDIKLASSDGIKSNINNIVKQPKEIYVESKFMQLKPKVVNTPTTSTIKSRPTSVVSKPSTIVKSKLDSSIKPTSRISINTHSKPTNNIFTTPIKSKDLTISDLSENIDANTEFSSFNKFINQSESMKNILKTPNTPSKSNILSTPISVKPSNSNLNINKTMTFEQSREMVDLSAALMTTSIFIKEKINQSINQHSNRFLKLASLVHDLQTEKFYFELETLRMQTHIVFAELFSNKDLISAWSALDIVRNCHQEMYDVVKFALYKFPTEGLNFNIPTLLKDFSTTMFKLKELSDTSKSVLNPATKTADLLAQVALMITNEKKKMIDMKELLSNLARVDSEEKSLTMQLIQQKENDTIG